MCDLLNRMWSRPRGEWTRVLRNELPVVADQMVDALQQGIPAISELLREMDREHANWAVEQALLAMLGYHRKDTSGNSSLGAAPGAVPKANGAGAVPMDRARRCLFEALVGARQASEISLAELSRSAGWPLPETVRAVVLNAPCEAPQLAAALGNALTGPAGGHLCLLVPDPDDGMADALVAVLRGRTAAVGHSVPFTDAASSVRWARRLLELVPPQSGGDLGGGGVSKSRDGTGIGGGKDGNNSKDGKEGRVVRVDDHLSMLLLLQDESLARALSSRWLEPLADLTPRQSERLEVTLLAWLEGGGAPEAAKTLQVHPQTVRYRLRQIEKLFGSALRDPRNRFELEMTLRGRRLLGQIRHRRARAGRRARAVTAGIRPLAVTREARVNGL